MRRVTCNQEKCNTSSKGSIVYVFQNNIWKSLALTYVNVINAQLTETNILVVVIRHPLFNFV
jgi:hypothetical protein